MVKNLSFGLVETYVIAFLEERLVLLLFLRIVSTIKLYEGTTRREHHISIQLWRGRDSG